jgi:hypothetical protein
MCVELKAVERIGQKRPEGRLPVLDRRTLVQRLLPHE